MRYLVIDLETIVDKSLPALKKKKDGSDTFPAPPYCEIAVMAAALLDADHRIQRLWVVEDQGERETLTALVRYLEGQHDITIVSWNGRGFDLPVIAARCLRHGLSFLWYHQQRDVRYRYSADGHLDLMDFADHGASRIYTLDLGAKHIGMPGKMDCKGADVAAMIAAGKIEEVRAYCMQDVAQTVALLLRVQLLRGMLDPSGYAVAVDVLLTAISQEPRLAPLLPLIDRQRLMAIPGLPQTVPKDKATKAKRSASPTAK